MLWRGNNNKQTAIEKGYISTIEFIRGLYKLTVIKGEELIFEWKYDSPEEARKNALDACESNIFFRKIIEAEVPF